MVAGAVALRREAQPLVFFLTDGHPTVGETDSGAILENVKKANEDCDAAIFSLAFGRMADFQMLKLLSLQNNAFARKIYVAADASLQLEGFYKEVSTQTQSVTRCASVFVHVQREKMDQTGAELHNERSCRGETRRAKEAL